MLEDGDGGERIVPIIAACGPDGRSNVSLSAVCLRVRDPYLLGDARPPACPPALPPSSGCVCPRVSAYASESGRPLAPALQRSVRPRARASTSGCRQAPQLTTPRPGDRTRRGCCWHRINCVYGAASAAPSPEVQPAANGSQGQRTMPKTED
jgi:hypothetical protein